ncbi:MAG: T9SS type A sorting domain-containing protein [Bacteroidia bacterium]|nr:T9SS type A sorting domain-containing protein [Bacteroidia bacterium]
MKKFLLLFFLAGGLAVNSQNLDKVVSGGPFSATNYSGFSKLKLCGDGGFLMCTLEYDPVTYLPLYTVIRTDAQLNKQWISKISTPSSSYFSVYDLGETPGGGYYVFGMDSYTYGIDVITLNSSGSQVWAKEISVPISGQYSSPKMKINAAGEFIIIPSQYDYMGFVRLDQNGNYLSGMCFKADSAEWKDPGFDGDVRDSSITLSGKAGSDNFFVNTDYSGNVNWSFRFADQNGGYHQPWMIKKANDGNFLISGYGYNDLIMTSGTAFFMKMDVAGNILLLKYYSSSLFSIGAINNVTELSSGGYLLESGGAFGMGSGITVYLKCDAAGNPVVSYPVDITSGVFSLDQNAVVFGGTKTNQTSGQPEFTVHKTDFNFSNKCNFLDYYGCIGVNGQTNFVLQTNSFYKFAMPSTVSNLPVTVTSVTQNYSVTDACLSIGVEENSITQNNSISLFPQPSNSNVTVQLSSQSTNGVTAEIFSLDGKMISSEKINTNSNSFQLSTSELANGLYLLKVMDGKEIVGVKKLMIEK